MVEVDTFDKSLFSKYKDSILKLMASKGCLDLSERISALIGTPGYLGCDNSEKVQANSFKGFFNRQNHGIIFDAEINNRALETMKNYLNLDPNLSTTEINEYFLNYNANQYHRRLMIIKDHNDRIFSGTNNNVQCRGNHVAKDLTLDCTDINNNKISTLCLPQLIFTKWKEFFTVLFKEIVSHSICNQCNNTNSTINDSKSIKLRAKNIGIKDECFYLFNLEVHGRWKEELKPPGSLITAFDNHNLNRYCDYLIITPIMNNEDHYVLNIASSHDTRIFTKVNGKIIVPVRFNKQLTIIKENGEKITLQNPDDIQTSFEINKEAINHLLLFNHHRYY